MDDSEYIVLAHKYKEDANVVLLLQGKIGNKLINKEDLKPHSSLHQECVRRKFGFIYDDSANWLLQSYSNQCRDPGSSED